MEHGVNSILGARQRLSLKDSQRMHPQAAAFLPDARDALFDRCTRPAIS